MAKRVFLTSKTVLAKSLAKKFLSIHFGVFGITISCQEPPILKKRFCLQQKKDRWKRITSSSLLYFKLDWRANLFYLAPRCCVTSRQQSVARRLREPETGIPPYPPLPDQHRRRSLHLIC